jgi:hypothetical protein
MYLLNVFYLSPVVSPKHYVMAFFERFTARQGNSKEALNDPVFPG